MAMLISKFHRLIQSRLLWGIFLVIIVFSFVIWGTKMPGQARQDREARAEGLLYGKPIPPEEYQHAYLNSRLGFALMMGRLPTPSAEFEKELRHAAWQRIVSEHKAHELGLPDTTDAEVISTVQRQPIFQTNGRFDEGRFALFVRSTLADFGANELQFEDYLREELLLEKLRTAVASTLLIPPTDVRQTLAAVSDEFRIEYAIIVPDTNAGARVTLKEAQALYDRDPKAFTIPEKVRVKYVEFPFSNYVASATVSVDEAINYYNEHLDRYTRLVASSNPPPAGATNTAPVVSRHSEQLPFELVKTNIFAALKNDAARTRATDVASDFVGSLSPDRHGKCLTFEQTAAKFTRPVLTAGPFANGETPPAVADVATFSRTAFALDTNVEERFSDVIRGPEDALVLYLDARLPARVPAFAEVAPQALAEARAEAQTKAQEDKANHLRTILAKAAATKPFGVPTMTVTGSVIMARTSTNEYAEVLLRGAMMHNPGEVCDVLQAPDGNLLVARVMARKATNQEITKAIQPQVFASLQHQRLRALDTAYTTYLLKEAQFVDRRARLATEAEPAHPEPGSAPTKPAVPADIY